MAYTINQLAKLAGVSVRTLHHYDHLGVLSPSSRTPAGYRLYGEAELHRLQQVLLYRELDLPLEEIALILDNPAFDPAKALAQHRRRLEAEVLRLRRLMATVDRSLDSLGGGPPLEDSELYEGLAREEVEAIKAEAAEAWGEAYEASDRRLRSWSKEKWQEVRAEGEVLEARFAQAFRQGAKPGSGEVLALCEAWSAHINRFYDAPPELVRGLGAMYAEDERFRRRYEALEPGLADFLKAALGAWAAS